MKIELDNNQKIAILGTTLFSILVVVVLMLIYMKPPYPPKELPGMEVSLGYAITGGGDNPVVASTQAQASEQSETPDKTITQNKSDVHVKKQSTTKTTQTKVVEADPDPVVNSKKIFDPTKVTGQNSGKGDDTGNDIKGNPNGNKNSNGNGPGGDSNGSFSLAGRTLKSLPAASTDFTENGKVTVKIYVNRSGVVTTAKVQERGTNTTSSKLRKLAVEAALKASFYPKSSANEAQVGTITYNFSIQN